MGAGDVVRCHASDIALYSLIAAMETRCLRRATGERDAIAKRETVCSTKRIGHGKGVK